MTANVLVDTIQDQAEEGEFDDLNDILGEFGRPEDLHFREADDGTLFVAAESPPQEVAARVELTSAGEIEADRIPASEVTWRDLSRVSSPGSGVQDRQFD